MILKTKRSRFLATLSIFTPPFSVLCVPTRAYPLFYPLFYNYMKLSFFPGP